MVGNACGEPCGEVLKAHGAEIAAAAQAHGHSTRLLLLVADDKNVRNFRQTKFANFIVDLLTAQIFRDFGYETLPSENVCQSDIVACLKFADKNKLIEFCRAIQHSSPIDSNAVVEPCDMPGYENQVIMASGSFNQGSSIELSCDAPIREPFIAYIQGGLTYAHYKIALINALSLCDYTIKK